MSAVFTRIRFRILVIVLLAIIPAVALIWFSAAERKRQMSDEIEGNTLRLARFLANNLERDLSEGEGYLAAVGEALRGKRLLDGGCSAAVGSLMGGSSVYSNVGLAGRDGKILCSGTAPGPMAGLGGLEWFHRLDSASGFSVGFDFNGGSGGEASVVLVLPVPAGAGTEASERRYVFAAMRLAWVDELANSSRLPEGSAISVTNLKGDAIARYPDPDKWVGRSRQAAADSQNLASREGTRITNGIDGVRRLYAYAKVAGKGNLVVNVGVAREALLEPANRALRDQLMALGIVAALAIMAAWFGADVFLLQQVRALIEATKKIGSGNLQARSTLSYESGELGELARAFDEMAETLEWRNAQLRESEIERADPLGRLSEFLECVPEAVLLMDDSLRIQACNKDAADLFALDADGIAGRSFRELCPQAPGGEASLPIAAAGDAARRFVSRLRARIGRPGPGAGPMAVEIALTRSRISQTTCVLALVRPLPEAEAQ